LLRLGSEVAAASVYCEREGTILRMAQRDPDPIEPTAASGRLRVPRPDAGTVAAQPNDPTGFEALGRAVDALDARTSELVVQARAELNKTDHHRQEVDRQVGWLGAISDEIGSVLHRHGVKPAGGQAAQDPSHWTPRRVTLGQGLEFIVVIDSTSTDPVSAALGAGLLTEPTLVSLMLQLVHPGQWVLDLGSHIGMFSLAAAAHGCNVIALEASPLNAALLRSAARRNRFHNLHVVNAAASDRGGELLFLPDGPWGHVDWEGSGPGAVPVPAIMVDDLLGEFGCGTASLIKMDVEGSEVKALAGMRSILSPLTAPPVLFESNAHTLELAGTSTRALFSAFEAYGYANHVVEPGRLVRIEADGLQPQTIIDALALKRRPPGLQEWIVTPGMTEEEVIRGVVAESAHANPDCRAYAARTMLAAGPAFRAQPRISGALELLRQDPVERVRAAAGGPIPESTRAEVGHP
jgi:FkbM family methyltransferase